MQQPYWSGEGSGNHWHLPHLPPFPHATFTAYTHVSLVDLCYPSCKMSRGPPWATQCLVPTPPVQCTGHGMACVCHVSVAAGITALQAAPEAARWPVCCSAGVTAAGCHTVMLEDRYRASDLASLDDLLHAQMIHCYRFKSGRKHPSITTPCPVAGQGFGACAAVGLGIDEVLSDMGRSWGVLVADHSAAASSTFILIPCVTLSFR